MTDSNGWIDTCLAATAAALKEKNQVVPDQVIATLARHMAGPLQTHLKPAEVRNLVVELASANSENS